MFSLKNKSVSTPPYCDKFLEDICHSELVSESNQYHPTSILPVRGGRTIPKNYRCGFTLAEVLITLVIIGVIAAITVPTLITKYRNQMFESQFKKSISIISQIILKTRMDLNVNKLGQYCSLYNGTYYYNQTECSNGIYKQIITLSKQKNNISRRNETIKTYNNKSSLINPDAAYASIFYVNPLVDGSFLGFNVNNGVLFFSVDLNGYKKPNRLGYDIFIFSVNNDNDAIAGFFNQKPTNISDEIANNASTYEYGLLSGLPCNLESTRESNGIGCAYFALKNTCPYDETKRYFECLH